MENERRGGGDGENFGWTRLEPAEPDYLLKPGDRPEIFLIETKSETPIGQEAANDPVSFFGSEIPEMGLGAEGMTVQVLRVNAEIAFNPVRKREVWMVHSQRSSKVPAPTAVGVQFKYEQE